MTTFEEFKQTFKGDIVDPASSEYEAAIDRYVLFPIDDEDVSEALKYLVGNNIPLAVKGGHNPSLTIDLSKYIDHVNVDPESKPADVGEGALWGPVDEATIAHGRATVGGTVSGTGVGSLSIGGGQGFLTGKHGQVVDNILEMTVPVILADGSIVKAPKDSYPNLFWGLRGGGPNFVTSPTKNGLWRCSLLSYPTTKLDELIATFDEWLPSIDEDQFVDLAFTRGPDGEPTLLVILFYNETPEEGRLKSKLFLDIGKFIEHKMFSAGVSTNYSTGPAVDMTQDPAINRLANELVERKRCYYMYGSSLRSDIAPHGTKLFERTTALSATPTDESKTKFDTMSVSSDAMAFRSRGPQPQVIIFISWDKHVPGDVDQARAISRGLCSIVENTAVQEVKEYENEGYRNYLTHPENLQNKALKLWGKNYPKLQKIKKQYDPQNIFNRWILIVPED